MLGRLYHADAVSIRKMVGDMPQDQRARLAFFCYGKAHMRDLGLTIAETVDETRLAQLAGTLGEVLVAQCRAKARSFGTDPLRRVTLPAKVSLAGR